MGSKNVSKVLIRVRINLTSTIVHIVYFAYVKIIKFPTISETTTIIEKRQLAKLMVYLRSDRLNVNLKKKKKYLRRRRNSKLLFKILINRK